MTWLLAVEALLLVTKESEPPPVMTFWVGLELEIDPEEKLYFQHWSRIVQLKVATELSTATEG
jgi:hypothetical protein